MAGNTSNTGSWVPQVHTVGLRNVGSYQVSGTPFVTGSGTAGISTDTKIEFPYVTKSFVVHQTTGNSTSAIRIHFVPTGQGNVISNRHYVQIKVGQSFEFNVKCKEVYLTPVGTVNFQLVAEMTNIPTGRMHALTGSGISE